MHNWTGVNVVDVTIFGRYHSPMMKHPHPHPIRYWRFMHGQRLLETATKLGISESFLSLVETNRRGLSREMAIKVEKKLGIPKAKLRPDLWGGA